MKNRYFLIGLLSILSSLQASIVAAENRAGAFTFTPGVSYYHFSSSRHLDNSAMPNLAFAYNFNDRWAAEAEAGFINTENSNGSGVNGKLYMLDGIYRFNTHGQWESYATGGVGVLNLPKLTSLDNQYQSNINAGLGTQFFIDKSIAFRGEVRDVYTLSGGKNDALINVGISFLI